MGERLEGRLFDLIELLEQARFGHKRAEALDLANVRVQVIGALFRLACDLRFLSAGQYGELAERLTRVGRQVAKVRQARRLAVLARRFRRGRCGVAEVRSSVMALGGHARWANAYYLRRERATSLRFCRTG